MWVLYYTPMTQSFDAEGRALYSFADSEEVGRYATWVSAIAATLDLWDNESSSRIVLRFGHYAIARVEE